MRVMMGGWLQRFMAKDNQTPISKEQVFEAWLQKCKDLAHEAAWQINPEYHRWHDWFAKGFTPHEAVTILFERARTGQE